MSLKNRFYKYKRALLALMIISFFTGSLYISVFTLSQNSTNYLPNLLNYLPNSNVNAKDYPIGWQPENGTIPVIEEVNGTYYNYSEPWQYQYLNGMIQTRIIYILQNSIVDYLLVGYLNGWNFNSTTSGTLVPSQDPNMNNYYWIQSPTAGTIINITFSVNQLYTYSGLNFVSGNEPITSTPGAIINRTGNTLALQLNNSGPWTNTSTILPGDPEMKCYAICTLLGLGYANPDAAIGEWTPDEYGNGRYSDDIQNWWQEVATLWAEGLVWNRYVANLSWFRGEDAETRRELKNITYSFEGYSGYFGLNPFANLYYKDDSGWHYWRNIGVGQNQEHTFSNSCTSNFDQLLQGANNDTLVYGAGVGAQSFWLYFWYPSYAALVVDQVKVQVDYNWRYTWANLTYHGSTFNTNDYPWLLIRYRTNGTSSNSWNFWLTSGSNNEAKLFTLNETNQNWQTLTLPINDGNTYDGFHVGKAYTDNNSNDWIEFDYVLTGRPIEVNSLDQNGNPNLQVSGDKSSGQLGTYYYPLNLSGTIREMDGYYNPISNLPCTLELWKTGDATAMYTDNVTNAFNYQINSLSTGLSEGNYTIKIIPYWQNHLYNNVQYDFHLIEPYVSITLPANNYTLFTNSYICINGVFNNLPPCQITNITINATSDTQFTLANPTGPGPYGCNGTFSFKATGVPTSNFSVTVSVQDQNGFIGTATRQVFVNLDITPINITSPSSDNTQVKYNNVWINGTYNGIWSQVTNITINDPRFTLISPTGSGPYGLTGTFSFKPNDPQGIAASEFDVAVTCTNQNDFVFAAMRHVNVTWGQGAVTWSFNVASFDGTVLPAKFYTSNAGTRQPLVVLVAGFGSGIYTWEADPILLDNLLLHGLTVVAYTQRSGASDSRYIPSFSYLMKDLYEVINTANQSYGGPGGVLDGSRIGLVGHSLGSYVVTMAACNDTSTSYLREYQSSLKVVVEGDGPANLYDAAQYIINKYNQAWYKILSGIGNETDWATVLLLLGLGLVNWIYNNPAALYEAASLSPVCSGENVITAVQNNYDHCDSIPHNLAFYVVHASDDGIIPLASNGDVLYNDITLDHINGQSIVVNINTLETTWDQYYVNHLTWANPYFCFCAANFVAAYI